MRVVVVGATGNLGTALLRRLAAEPSVEVVGVARRMPAPEPPYAAGEWHAIDIAKQDAGSRLDAAFRGADAVVHLAWRLQPNRRERVLHATNVVGTGRVLDAAGRAGMGQVLVASSVGAYSPGPKHDRVGESWPTGGLHTSHYARHKAINERRLDEFERRHPSIVVTRIRPGLVFQADAAAEISRLFVGPLVPDRLLGRLRLPIVPLPSILISQVVHADDVADAIWRAIDRSAGGAFNLAAEPVMTPALLAEMLGGRAVPLRRAVLRALVWASWTARLQPSDPGWIDIATSVPVMSTERARTELGWAPAVTSTAALRELLGALAADHLNPPSAPLA